VKAKPDKILYRGNPFLTGVFTNETTFVACGFDKTPFLFKKNGTEWAFVSHLDAGFAVLKAAQIAKGSFEQ
jgi:hypothetical protein